MKSILCALLGTVACAVAGYDPLAVGPQPGVVDREFKHGERTVPVRVFTPAGGGSAPVILFSHGLGGSREGSNFLGRHWSARGYVTVFLQHPGSDSAVWRDTAPADAMPAMKRAASGENLRLRVADVSGVLDALERANADPRDPLHGRLDLARVGMAGHSFGAKTTQVVAGEHLTRGPRSALFTEPRIKAALPMSPSPSQLVPPEVSFGRVAVPWCLMTGTHDGAPAAIVPTQPADRLRVYPALPAGNAYELVLDGAEHSAFTERRLPGEARPRNPNHHRVILAVSTAFWDAYLKQQPEAKHWLRHQARSVMNGQDRWQWK